MKIPKSIPNKPDRVNFPKLVQFLIHGDMLSKCIPKWIQSTVQPTLKTYS